MKRLKSSKKRLAYLGLAFLVVLAIVVGSAIFLNQDRHAPVEPPKLAKAQFNEEKPTKEEEQEYKVEPELPRAIYIQKIDIMGVKIIPVGLDKDGAMGAPDSIYEVGWYKHSAKPGSGTDAVLLDGHVSGINDPNAVFHRLKELTVGDQIVIEKGDGKRISYTVRETEQLPIEKVDMNKAMSSIQADKEGLNIITCGGKYDYSRQLYEDRVLVYASRDRD